MSYYKCKIEQENEQTKLSTQTSMNDQPNTFLLKMECALDEIDINDDYDINKSDQSSLLFSPRISYVGEKELLDSISELCI